MNASAKQIAFLTVALLGLYGCAKAPISQSGDDRAAREKLQKLEAEHKTLVTTRDQFRERTLSLEKQQAKLNQELESLRVSAARDAAAFADQIRTRTAERDTLQVQYDGFRKTIKELLGQAEASLASPAPLAATSSDGNSPRN